VAACRMCSLSICIQLWDLAWCWVLANICGEPLRFMACICSSLSVQHTVCLRSVWKQRGCLG
jgi:hypothetical protein